MNGVQLICKIFYLCTKIARGQTINKEKSSVMFSKNTKSLEKNQFMASLGITTEALNEKYLGLPMYMGSPSLEI